MHRTQSLCTPRLAPSLHTGVRARTCSFRHLPPAVFLLCDMGRDHPDRAESPACTGVERLFPSWIWWRSQGAGKVKEYGGRGGDRSGCLKPMAGVELRTLTFVCTSLKGLPASPPLPSHLYLPSPPLPALSCSPGSPLCGHMPWQCQELLPPGSWETAFLASLGPVE